MDTRERTWIRTKNYLPYAVLLVPAFAFYTVFGIVPVFRAIYTSTTDWSGLGTSYHFVGLANYISLFTDTNVLWTFQATFEYTLSVTVFQNVSSIILAFILNQNLNSRNVLRSLIFMPTLFSGLIMGYIWSFLYSEPIMELGKAIHSTVLGNNVLGSQNFAIFAAAFMDIWRGTGYTMVIYIAGLQNIPFELEDAANIDASPSRSRHDDLRHSHLRTMLEELRFDIRADGGGPWRRDDGHGHQYLPAVLLFPAGRIRNRDRRHVVSLHPDSFTAPAQALQTRRGKCEPLVLPRART